LQTLLGAAVHPSGSKDGRRGVIEDDEGANVFWPKAVADISRGNLGGSDLRAGHRTADIERDTQVESGPVDHRNIRRSYLGEQIEHLLPFGEGVGVT
jgi:hypothetical protein